MNSTLDNSLPSLNELISTILTNSSGKYSYDWISRISGYHKMKSNSEFDQAINRIHDELQKIGYSREHLEWNNFPADGRTKVWEWSPTKQWEVSSAELWLESPYRKRLASYSDLPLSLVTHSQSANLSAEVIDVGKGNNDSYYEGKDIEGKIVLLSSLMYENHQLYEKYGAIGALSYPDLARAGNDPTLILYDSIFGDEKSFSKSTFGFSLSYEQAYEIKTLLEQGTVVVSVDIKAEVSDGKFTTLSARIPGKECPDKEILIMGHLCHPNPGANDNASGVAATLEIAKNIFEMIQKKEITPPKYSIRFLWAAEYMGTVRWMHFHQKKLSNTIAMINLDMVGLSLLKAGYPLTINVESGTYPSWFQVLLPRILENISDHPKSIATHGNRHPLAYEIKPMEGGSDHTLFCDPYFGIPAIMFGGKDPFYHSSKDLVGNCDPTRLKRVVAIATTLAYFYANPNILIMKDVEGDIIRRIHGLFDQTSQLIYRSKSKFTAEHIKLSEILINTAKSQLILLLTNLKSIFLKTSGYTNWNFFLEIVEERYLLEIKALHYYHSKSKEDGNKIDPMPMDLQISPRQTFSINSEGPIANSALNPLYSSPLINDFILKTNMNFGGAIFELLFLVRSNREFMEIWANICIEYNYWFTPKYIEQILQIFKEKNLIAPN